MLTGFMANPSPVVIEKNTPLQVLSNHIQQKLNALSLLQTANIIEISFPKEIAHPYQKMSVLENILHSNGVLSLHLKDIEILQDTYRLGHFKYRINLKECQWKLFEMILCYPEVLAEDLEEADILVPKGITSVEKLDLKIGCRDVFHKISVIESLLNLKVVFTKGFNLKAYFNDALAESLAQYTYSSKLLENLEIHISDGSLTAKGIKDLEDKIEDLLYLKSLKLYFNTCPYITEDSIRSLAETMKNRSRIESLTLKFECCANISTSLVPQLSEKLKDSFKGEVDIEVMPIPLSQILKNA